MIKCCTNAWWQHIMDTNEPDLQSYSPHSIQLQPALDLGVNKQDDTDNKQRLNK